MNAQTNYGNWVPEKMFPPLFGGGAVLLAAGLVCGFGLHKTVLAVVLAVLGIILLAYGAYMYRCHEAFAFGKGNMMAKVREALRVVKKGGAFAFQDMFSQKGLYGNMDEFVKQLQAEGISEIHFIGDLEQKLDFVPGYVRTPWMISSVGIIYGRK